MAPPGTSPRKTIPLSTGEESAKFQFPTTSSSITRAFFCGVVVELGAGKDLDTDLRALVGSLGEHIPTEDGTAPPETLRSSTGSESGLSGGRKRAMTNSSALTDVINEFISTERSYVKRLRILKEAYADPLRTFAKAKDTALLSVYDTKILFGNIDAIVPVNQAFLEDLEHMMAPNGHQTVGGIGDVCLKHFKDLGAFDCYKQFYAKREEAQSILKREKLKKSTTGFSGFIERIKESTADVRNRVGLSELLMDPVQRIPRYTLLWDLMVKYMPVEDPQRAKLLEAAQIAQKIAKCEIDDLTRRAAVMHCLGRTIDGFPPGLISNGRRLLDCIDVDDIPTDPFPAASSTSMSSSVSLPGTLHSTLFLFDDKLMIVKRPSSAVSGKVLTGLDQVDKAAKSGSLPVGLKKNGLVFKGVVDLTDFAATDNGGPDMHMYFETPPQDQSERWTGRPFRVYSVVYPPSPVNLDPVATQSDKQRFLDNLWIAQAMFRAREGRSVVLSSAEREVESRSGRTTSARTYFNVYQRTAYLSEPKKAKIVVHIDATGSADALPFGINGPPYVLVRAQPLAGDLCKYSVTSSDPDDDGEIDIVHTATIPARIVQTIHQFGLFNFRTGHNSIPSTPTASLRSRAGIFGLDTISRNLFPGAKGKSGDVFGSVLQNNTHRRTRSTTSRASTQTATTMDSNLKFSTRSTSTAATSFMQEDDPIQLSPSPGKTSGRNAAMNSLERSNSGRSRARSMSSIGESMLMPAPTEDSDRDLTERLELARKNSQIQPGRQLPALPRNPPVHDTIYEEEPPPPSFLAFNRPTSPSRPTSPGRPMSPSRPMSSSRPLSPTQSMSVSRPISPARPASPVKGSETPSTQNRSRSLSAPGVRPGGPRPPSPLPARDMDVSRDSIVIALESTLDHVKNGNPLSSITLTRKRSKSFATQSTRRMPLESKVNEAKHGADGGNSIVEPLSIKKKTSVRSAKESSPPARQRSQIPKLTSTSRTSRTSPRGTKRTLPLNDQSKLELSERLTITARTTREDLDTVRRSVKRIKLEVASLKTSFPSEKDADSQEMDVEPTTSRNDLFQSPSRQLPKSEAEARREEMRQVIALRQVDSPFRRRELSNSPQKSHSKSNSAPSVPVLRLNEFTESIEGLLGQADTDLQRMAANQDVIRGDLELLTGELKARNAEVVTLKTELSNSKAQCELVKNLLGDASAENDFLHAAFNEELDKMFNDANLPDDEAWKAMSRDLREAKAARNELKRENSSLKRKLEEIELQKEQWGELLRAHGLIP